MTVVTIADASKRRLITIHTEGDGIWDATDDDYHTKITGRGTTPQAALHAFLGTPDPMQEACGYWKQLLKYDD